MPNFDGRRYGITTFKAVGLRRYSQRANALHPKVVRQALRLAFLSPEVTSAILDGRHSKGLALARIPKLLPLSWTEHRHLLA
jgi:hypothetical protein